MRRQCHGFLGFDWHSSLQKNLQPHSKHCSRKRSDLRPNGHWQLRFEAYQHFRKVVVPNSKTAEVLVLNRCFARPLFVRVYFGLEHFNSLAFNCCSERGAVALEHTAFAFDYPNIIQNGSNHFHLDCLDDSLGRIASPSSAAIQSSSVGCTCLASIGHVGIVGLGSYCYGSFHSNGSGSL